MLKDKILDHLIKRKTSDGPTPGTSYSEARNIGVLFNDGTKESVLSIFKSALDEDNKNIQWLMRIKDLKNKRPSDYPTYHEKNVSVMGKIGSTDIDYFQRQSLDMIVLLDDMRLSTVRYILAGCKEARKIGFYEDSIHQNLLDFMLKPKQEQHKYDELLSYLRLI